VTLDAELEKLDHAVEIARRLRDGARYEANIVRDSVFDETAADLFIGASTLKKHYLQYRTEAWLVLESESFVELYSYLAEKARKDVLPLIEEIGRLIQTYFQRRT
jgi:hypothetical protein